jgi:hypothetical protein
MRGRGRAPTFYRGQKDPGLPINWSAFDLSLNHHTSHTLHLYLGDGATSSNHRPGSTGIATITPTRIILPKRPRRTAKDDFRGTRDETVKLGETDTGDQVSVTQVGPKKCNGTKFQRRRRKKRSRVKWKEKNNPREDSSRNDGSDAGRTRSVVIDRQ